MAQVRKNEKGWRAERFKRCLEAKPLQPVDGVSREREKEGSKIWATACKGSTTY